MLKVGVILLPRFPAVSAQLHQKCDSRASHPRLDLEKFRTTATVAHLCLTEETSRRDIPTSSEKSHRTAGYIPCGS